MTVSKEGGIKGKKRDGEREGDLGKESHLGKRSKQSLPQPGCQADAASVRGRKQKLSQGPSGL